MSEEIAYFEDVSVIKETEKAILCLIEGEEYWVAKSLIHEDSQVTEMGDDGILIVPRWWAKKNSLEAERWEV